MVDIKLLETGTYLPAVVKSENFHIRRNEGLQ